MLPEAIQPGVWYPFAELPPGLPGYLLVRDRVSGWDDRPIPHGVPIVISWEPYTQGAGYQFTEKWIHDQYKYEGWGFIQFMLLP